MRTNLLQNELCSKLLWNEYTILRRMIYKNSSQHRRLVAYKKVQHVKRIMNKVKLLVNGLSEEQLQENLDALLCLFSELENSTQKAYIEYRKILSLTHFMSTCLVFLSILARLKILSRFFQAEIKSLVHKTEQNA